jgi:hypothetical protein
VEFKIKPDLLLFVCLIYIFPLLINKQFLFIKCVKILLGNLLNLQLFFQAFNRMTTNFRQFIKNVFGWQRLLHISPFFLYKHLFVLQQSPRVFTTPISKYFGTKNRYYFENLQYLKFSKFIKPWSLTFCLPNLYFSTFDK